MADADVPTLTNNEEDGDDEIELDTKSKTDTSAEHSADMQNDYQINVIRVAIRGNIILIGFTFFLTFIAYNGIANLQSSLNHEDHLGTLSLCALHLASTVSSILLPTDVIR